MITSTSWLRRSLFLVTFLAVCACAGCASPAQNSNHSNSKATTPATFSPKFLWRLGATADALKSPIGIAVDKQGNVYVTDNMNKRIQKFDNAGKRLAILGNASQFISPYAIAVDGQGDVYVADTGHIRKFDANGQLLTSWDLTLSYVIMDIKMDGKGDLYTLAYTQTNTALIQEFDSSGKILASWNSGKGSFGMAVDSQGDVYVTDQGPMRVEKYDSHGKLLTQWGGKGNGEGQFAGFLGQGIAVDIQGNVYVYDQNDRIQKFDADGHLLTVWQDNTKTLPRKFGGITGIALDQQGHLFAANEVESVVYKFDSAGNIVAQFGNDGIGTGAGQLTYPWSVAIDGQGNLYVDDTDRVQKFDSSGHFLAAWNIPGLGMAVDRQGDVYVMDSYDVQILKYDTNGQLLTQWGSKGSGKGQFDEIEGITIDGQGNVFILDRNLGIHDPAGHTPRIQKFDGNGRFLTMWSIEKHGYQIAADEQGQVYLADYGTQTALYAMQEFDGNGRLLTQWAISKSITAYSFTLDKQGNVYIGGTTYITRNTSPYPSTSEGIYKFDNRGRVIGHYDSKGNGNGQFSSINGIAVDEQGNIYTADFWNRCVQKFQQV